MKCELETKFREEIPLSSEIILPIIRWREKNTQHAYYYYGRSRVSHFREVS